MGTSLGRDEGDCCATRFASRATLRSPPCRAAIRDPECTVYGPTHRVTGQVGRISTRQEGTVSTGEVEGAGRPRRVVAGEVLESALDGLDGVTEALAAELLAELGRGDANRAQRIQSAIESATDG